MPKSLFYVWDWFVKLNNTRQSGVSLSPITHQEILSFCLLYDIKMRQWEVDLIKLLDRVVITEKDE